MALGFKVYVIGVHRLDYREAGVTAWRRDPPWFDGWALADDPRMRLQDADQLMGLFTPKEVQELHATFVKRVRPDGQISPTPTDLKIVSDDPPPDQRTSPWAPSVEEFERLLEAPRLSWVIIHLWDIS